MKDVYLILMIALLGGSIATCLSCVMICLKIYTEMMKEHTIRKRYETQRETDASSKM